MRDTFALSDQLCNNTDLLEYQLIINYISFIEITEKLHEHLAVVVLNEI